MKDDFWGPVTTKTAMKNKKSPKPPSKQELLWKRRIALRRTSLNLDGNRPAWKTKAGSEAGHLLCHAKVYVFAECYGITQLMTLSYNKLHQSLIDLNLHAKTLADVIGLAQYSYETLVPDDLKELVVLFAACEVERLWKEEQFQDLLGTHSGLGKAIIGAVLDRLE